MSNLAFSWQLYVKMRLFMWKCNKWISCFEFASPNTSTGSQVFCESHTQNFNKSKFLRDEHCLNSPSSSLGSWPITVELSLSRCWHVYSGWEGSFLACWSDSDVMRRRLRTQLMVLSKLYRAVSSIRGQVNFPGAYQKLQLFSRSRISCLCSHSALSADHLLIVRIHRPRLFMK